MFLVNNLEILYAASLVISVLFILHLLSLNVTVQRNNQNLKNIRQNSCFNELSFAFSLDVSYFFRFADAYRKNNPAIAVIFIRFTEL